MKDTWTQAFQERLGDYELDMPVPAGVPGRRRILPWLTTAAAAAALALLLLLPGRRQAGNPLSATQLIAEALPQVQASQPALSAARLLPIRSLQPHSVSSAIPIMPVTDETVENEQVTEVVSETIPTEEPTPATNPVSVSEPTPVGAIADVWPEDWPEEPVQARRNGGLSAKLYAGNFTAGEARFQTTSDLMSMRDASAEYRYNDLVENDNLFSNSLKEAKHAYNVKEMPGQETVCDLPLKTGLSIRYDISPRLGIESGLTYGYHHAKQSYSGNLSGSYYRDYKMHYLGIPLKATLTLTNWEKAALYMNLGGEAELLAGGSITAIDGVTRNKTVIGEHPFQFSLLGGAGAEYFFTRQIGLYAEPGLAWHLLPASTLPNYYREHPWSFDLRVGLRLRL